MTDGPETPSDPELIEGVTPTEGEQVSADELRAMGYSDFEPFEPFVSENLLAIETDKYGWLGKNTCRP